MVATSILGSLAPEDYLAAEALSPVKHEYIDGQVYAMAGASDVHVTIAGNLFILLKAHLRGSQCRTYISDMKVHIEELNIFYYPDVLVTCDERDRSTSTYKRYPSVIAEVLSPATEGFDRGDKFLDYQHIETLTDYLLINTTRQRIDGFCRRDDGLWVMQSYAVGQTLTLLNLQFAASVEALYEEVNWAETASDGDLGCH